MLMLIMGLGVAHAVEWRAMAAGEINADSHGVIDAGVRSGPWSAVLLTDTLDLRWQPEGDHGKAWVTARGEFGAAGLMISPWVDGAPAPERALGAFYTGPEAGALRYLAHGLYAGVSGHARWWWFSETEASEVAAPDGRARAQADAQVGWWQPSVQAWIRAGADFAPTANNPIQPHVQGELKLRPDEWTVAPRVELRAGWGANQDDLSRTRAGGLNPYVVPLAGAAWAEFRVEEYAAARVGPSVAVGGWDLAAVVDVMWGEHQDAAADTPPVIDALGSDCQTIVTGAWTQCDRATEQHVGFGLLTRWQPRRLFVAADAGLAPWLPRQQAVAASVWAAVGVDWGQGGIRYRSERSGSPQTPSQ